MEHEIQEQIFLESNFQSICNILKNFSKKAITIGAIYLAGYFNISPAWLLGILVLLMMREHLKLEKEHRQQIAMIAALQNERNVVFCNIDNLPPWVYFPDVDRCEWVNRILTQIWPNFSKYIKEFLINNVEPDINKAFSYYKKDSFKLSVVNLGLVPPRIGGVKVYEKNKSRNEIIVDMNLFYAGDCDFSFYLLGFEGGIKNFQMYGLLRIVMKPLITRMPLFGCIEIFYLHKPKIDFNLVGVAYLLEMPGLSTYMRQVIDDQIASIMVLPNRLSFHMTNEVISSKPDFPEPEGVLRVNIIEARDLVIKDTNIISKGSSDPYVIVKVRENTFRSSTIEKSLNPKWDFWVEFIIDALYGETISITVMDKDNATRGQDDFLGDFSLELSVVKEKGMIDTWIQLENTNSGMVHLCMFYFQLSNNRDDYILHSSEPPFLSSFLLILFVDSAENLINPLKTKQLPDTLVSLDLGSINKTTKTVSSSGSPIFKESFTFLVKNIEYDRLKIELIDQKTKTKLGRFNFKLVQLLDCELMELLDYRCPLIDTATESTIVLSMKLKILKDTGLT